MTDKKFLKFFAVLMFISFTATAKVCFLPDIFDGQDCGVSFYTTDNLCENYTITDPTALYGSNYRECYRCERCPFNTGPNASKYACESIMGGENPWHLDGNGQCTIDRAEACTDYTISNPTALYGEDYTHCYNCSQCSNSTSDNYNKHKCTAKALPDDGYQISSDGRCTATGSPDPCEGYDIDSPSDLYGPFYTNCYSCTQCTDANASDEHLGKYSCTTKSPILNNHTINDRGECIPPNNCANAFYLCSGGREGVEPKCPIGNGDYLYADCQVRAYCDGSADYMDENNGRCYFETWINKLNRYDSNNENNPYYYKKIGKCQYSGDLSQEYTQYIYISPDSYARDCYGNPNPLYGKVPCNTSQGGTNCYGQNPTTEYVCATAPSETCQAISYDGYYWCEECGENYGACYYDPDTGAGYYNGHRVTYDDFSSDDVYRISSFYYRDAAFTLTDSSHEYNTENGFYYQNLYNAGWVAEVLCDLDHGSYGSRSVIGLGRCSAKTPNNPVYNVETGKLMVTCSSVSTGVRYLYARDENGHMVPLYITNENGETRQTSTVGIECGDGKEYFDECSSCVETNPMTYAEREDCINATLGEKPENAGDACVAQSYGTTNEVGCGPFICSTCAGGSPCPYIYKTWVTNCNINGIGCNGSSTSTKIAADNGYTKCANGESHSGTCVTCNNTYWCSGCTGSTSGSNTGTGSGGTTSCNYQQVETDCPGSFTPKCSNPDTGVVYGECE